ncbi:MAG: DNA starvation/stationary phase protection protein [Flavobacteriales bacterium]|nr:DNA starvation/stationary phase protection protein [Flavobacteriales bacterium]
MGKKLNAIGIEPKSARKLAQQLNDLLAAYQVFYMNVRGFHWNIRGDKFFELHQKFEELYNDLLIKIDEVAERILTLGETPFHTYTDYLKKAGIPETPSVSDGREAVEHILKMLSHVLELQREVLKTSAEAGDEGTNALMSDYIRAQEKLVWMYTAYLG